MINSKDVVVNSALAGLGSPQRIAGSFAVSAQSIASGGIVSLAPQRIPLNETQYLTATLFNISLETGWRVLKSADQLTFDTANQFYVGGFLISNGSTKFSIYINTSYEAGFLTVFLNIANRLNTVTTVNTPAFTFSILSYIHEAPF